MEVVKEYATHLYEGYNYYHARGDPRTAEWPLVENLTPTLVLTGLYLLTVWLLPQIMANRKPMQLQYVMIIYNLSLVALNFHIAYELITNSIAAGYSFKCQPIVYSFDEAEVRISKALWWYYVSKLFEFMDTIIFILRKKQNQVSFLHVYHHASMFPIWWIGVKWVAGGQSFFGALLNSSVHVLMYLYYGLAAIGPQMQKYLGWKRYLTQIQFAQFFIGMLNAYSGIYTRCDFPLWMGWALIIYGTSITALFVNFYIHAYSKPKTAIKKKGEEAVGDKEDDISAPSERRVSTRNKKSAKVD